MHVMKKLALIVSVLILIGLFVPTALAAMTPQAPVIGNIDPVFAARNSVTRLTVSASVSDGGTLEYQWYETPNGTLPSIMAIIGEYSSTFTCNTSVSGTRYYVCMVTNTIGSEISRSYSNVIAVTVYEPIPMVSYNSTNIELDKMEEYTITANIQLQPKDIGTLTYTWYVSNNNYIGVGDVISGATTKHLSLNGSNETGTKYYYCIVRNSYLGVTYSMNVEDMSIVKVVYTGKEHVHQFGPWMITTEPGCTEEGIRARECLCGVTERESIPALGHDLEDWRIDPNNPMQEIRSCRRPGCEFSETRAVAKMIIERAEIKIVPPQTGATTSSAWSVGAQGGGFAIDEAESYWEYNVEGQEGVWKQSLDDVFKEKTIYRASVLLTPNGDYGFNDSTQYVVNGNTIVATVTLTGQVRLNYSFPETSDTEKTETSNDDDADRDIQDDQDEDKGGTLQKVLLGIAIVGGAAGVIAGGIVFARYLIRRKKA